jgi:hypothetical protein
MDDELGLREKLRKIEALFAGAATPGEKAAAGAAAERIRARLRRFAQAERAVEVRFSIADPWSRRLFIALCRRYGLRPYRHARMKRQTVVVRAPRSFLASVLWPEFVQIDAALMEFLAHVTDKVIRDAVFKETGEAEEVPESGGPG